MKTGRASVILRRLTGLWQWNPVYASKYQEHGQRELESRSLTVAVLSVLVNRKGPTEIRAIWHEASARNRAEQMPRRKRLDQLPFEILINCTCSFSATHQQPRIIGPITKRENESTRRVMKRRNQPTPMICDNG
jgi:hypothetical protein